MAVCVWVVLVVFSSWSTSLKLLKPSRRTISVMAANELRTITKPMMAETILFRAASVLVFSPPDVIHWNAPMIKAAKTKIADKTNTTFKPILKISFMFAKKPTGSMIGPITPFVVAELVDVVVIVVLAEPLATVVVT